MGLATTWTSLSPRIPQQRQLLYALFLFSLLCLLTRHFWYIQAYQPPSELTEKQRVYSKIAKITVAINNINATGSDRCLQSHEVQNEMHGYKHFLGSTGLVSEKQVPSAKMASRWSKHAYMLQTMLTELQKPVSERLEWLFWFDADTLILNPYIKLETFLPPASSQIAANLKLLIARNWDGINDGAFLIRIDLWSVALLSSILAWPTYHHMDKPPLPHEQEVMSTLLHTVPNFQHNWTVVPHRWFNSFPINNVYNSTNDWLLAHPMTPETFDNGEHAFDKKTGKDITLPWKVLKGDMAVHFAGCEKRKSWIDPWADRADMQLPEWSGTPHQTVLEEEVRLFWKQWKPKVEKEVGGIMPIKALGNNTFF